jgi:hypothetical protein
MTSAVVGACSSLSISKIAVRNEKKLNNFFIRKLVPIAVVVVVKKHEINNF